MSKCSFCNKRTIAQHDILFEDNQVVVILSKDWVIKGHTLVIWKDHVKNVADLSIDQYQYFSKLVYITEKALLAVLKKDKSIILKSGGFESHFHFHIYPVDSTITWDETLALFEMKSKYDYTEFEKNKFLKKLQSYYTEII